MTDSKNSDTQTHNQLETVIVDPFKPLPEGFLEDPYPRLNKMREQSPVLFSKDGNQWLVLGFDEATAILRSGNCGKQLWKHNNFVVRQALRVSGQSWRSSILLQDPPDHTRVRSLLSKTFSPRVVAGLEERMAQTADHLIEKMIKKPTFDLIADFAFPLPIIVIAELLGVPPSDRLLFREWSSRIISGSDGSQCPMRRIFHAFSAIRELRGYICNLIKQKRKSPQSDLISLLIEAQEEGYKNLTDQELLENSMVILIAGHETTANLIGNSVLNLMRYPEQKEIILEKPDTIPGAIEEVLRFDPPAQIIRRMTEQPLEVGGKRIREGDAIAILVGACNRDPRAILQPDTFDILRQSSKHLSFGGGIHYCLGAELSRTETRIALERLFERIPKMRLLDVPLQYKSPYGLRCPKELLMTAR